MVVEFIRFLNRIDQRQTLPYLDIHLIIDNYATHSWAKTLGGQTVAEKTPALPHPFHPDTMHFRFKPRRNPGSQSQHRSVNRTAVG